ncbi:uromodulin-like [Lissotriton helveticus]
MMSLLLLSVLCGFLQPAFLAPITCPACAADQICNIDAGTCDCDQTKYEPLGGFKFVLYCNTNYMEAVLATCQLEKDMYDPNTLHLSYTDCQGQIRISGSQAVIVLKNEITNGSCGNILSDNGTHVTISNTLTIATYVTGFSQTVNISCTYDSSYSTSEQTTFVPMLLTSFSNQLKGYGSFSAQMSLYRDSAQQDPVLASDLLYVGDQVFLVVEVPDLDESQFSMLVKSLFAAPVANLSSVPQYNLITEGCPNDLGVRLVVQQNGRSKLASFEMSMFKLVNYDSFVLFADLFLCESSCSLDCPSTA